jgi:hypothetical protein
VATWNDLCKYVRANYKIMKEDANSIMMGFAYEDGRSQVVFLWRMTLMDGTEEWVQIESPIGEFTPANVAAVVRAAERSVVGGIGCSQDVITYRHAVPLANLDMNEFLRPLRLVTVSADQFEKQVFGGDKF